MFDELESEDRLRLMRFVCSFAWADLRVGAAERDFVRRLSQNLGLNNEELERVQQWLVRPPPPEDIDPQDIPAAHRELFLIAIKATIATDGRISSREAENLLLLEQLLTGDDQTGEWEVPSETEEIPLDWDEEPA